MIEQFMKLLNEKGIEHFIVACCFILISMILVAAYKEYKEEKEDNRQLHEDKDKLQQEKLEQAHDMLKMAQEYNNQTVNLQRETSSTITSLLAAFNLMRDRNKE